MTKLHEWIGEEESLFDRVCHVFQGLGYTTPVYHGHIEDITSGAYVSNIQEQYIADFSPEQVLQIIDYAKSHSLEELEHHDVDPGVIFTGRKGEQ